MIVRFDVTSAMLADLYVIDNLIRIHLQVF